jgi:hypothetical protein
MLETALMPCLYQVTNLLNGKYYIGVHCDAANTAYMGSGKGIKAAIRLYGKEHFRKDILAEHEDEAFIYQLEGAVVNQPFVESRDNYNQCVGGKIPPNRMGKPHRLDTRQTMSRLATGNHYGLGVKHPTAGSKISAAMLGNQRGLGHHRSPEVCQRISARMMGNTNSSTPKARANNRAKRALQVVSHSPETRQRMREAALRREANKRALLAAA